MVDAADGSAFTGSVTVAVTGDGGTQATGSVGSGACTHEGNGFHTYTPSQAETNYSHVAFTFTGAGAIPVTLQVYPGVAPVTAPDNFSDLEIDSSGRVLLQPTQAGVTIPTVTTLTNTPSDSSGVTTLLSRLSSTRAGYLDNLSAGAVATASALSTVAGYLDTEIAEILQNTGTDIPDLIEALDILIDAIKAKTDSLTFTQSGQVDANVRRINNVTLTGTGTSGSEWGPA